MDYYTDQNDLKKMDGVPSKGPGLNSGTSKAKVMDIFVSSIIKIKNLAKLSMENTNSGFIKYVIFISLLCGLISFAVPTASKLVSFGGLNKLFTKTIPAFSVKDGTLMAERKFEIKLSSATIMMDTTINEFRRDDFDYPGIFVTLGSKRIKMISYPNVSDPESYNEVYSFAIRDVLIEGFNNQKLASMSVIFYITMIIIFIFTCLFAAIRYVFFAGVLCIFTRTSTALCKLPMTLRDTFHLNLYAQTISIILVNANEAIGFINPIITSFAGIVITIFVINRALKPHMPNFDEMMDNFNNEE